MPKFSPNSYARALVSIWQENRHRSADNLLSAWVNLIKKQGDWAKRKQILSAAEKMIRSIDGKKLITIESARPLSPAQRKTLESAWPKSRDGQAGTDWEEKITPELLGGARINVDGETELDGSLARVLRKIFQQ